MSRSPRIILHNSETEQLAAWLRDAMPGADFCECRNYEGLPDLIATYRPEVIYSVRFAGTPGFPRDAIFGADGPKWFANGGAGTDHLATWDPARTIVTNAAGVAAKMMAEYMIGCFLHFSLDVPGLMKDKAARVWNSRIVSPLSGKTLLIVGLGHTGQALANLASAFGMTVIGTRARPKEMPNVDEVHPASNLHALLPRADFIGVATPLTPATKGLIGGDEIAAMKDGVVIADVSRGGVVDQGALFDALDSGHIAGAGLDVFETEPLPETSPLWSLENVIISPHCSSVSADWEEASFRLFLKNLRRWIDGETLINIVDPERGY